MKENQKHGHMHLHTPASDGLITPQDIIDAKLDFVAITDHDSIDSIAEFSRILEPSGINVIPGIEITTTYLGKNMHVILQDIKYEQPFLDCIDLMRENRMKRARGILHGLRDLGFVVTDRFVNEWHGTISKGNIIREVYSHQENIKRIKEEGLLDGQKFADKYLVPKSPAYVKMQRIELPDYLRHVDGTKILAHPGHNLKMGKDDYIIESLVKDFGFIGMEVNTRKHDEEEKKYYANLADRLGVMPVTSNDCHIKAHLYENKESEETLERLLGMKVNI